MLGAWIRCRAGDAIIFVALFRGRPSEELVSSAVLASLH